MNRELFPTFDYRKLPAWWRDAEYSDCAELCKQGKHVPVKELWPNSRVTYHCQNCGIKMAAKQWHAFFDKARISP